MKNPQRIISSPFSVFQLIVLVSSPATLLFWFTVTAHICIIFRHAVKGAVFSLKALKGQLYATCSAPKDRQS